MIEKGVAGSELEAATVGGGVTAIRNCFRELVLIFTGMYIYIAVRKNGGGVGLGSHGELVIMLDLGFRSF